MILVGTLLAIICFSFSSEEPQILQIPVKHSLRKVTDAEVEKIQRSKSERSVPDDSNYNLHGMVGLGYYIELAIGQPEQLVNNIHILLYHIIILLSQVVNSM